MIRWPVIHSLCLLVVLGAAPVHAAVTTQPVKAVTLTSPDGKLVITFQTRGKDAPADIGTLTYAVTFDGKPLLEPSAIRLDIKGQKPLGEAVRIAQQLRLIDWNQTEKLAAPGKCSQYLEQFKGVSFEVDEPGGPAEATGGAGRRLLVEARAFNDAVAFRYYLEEQEAIKDFKLAGERTEFRVVKDADCWALLLPNYRSTYESEYINLPLTAFAYPGGIVEKSIIGLPLLMNVPGVAWVAISEADLKGTAAMYLTVPHHSWVGHYAESRLAPHVDDPSVAVVGKLPYQSAWRVIQVADDPCRLIESNVLAALSPPPDRELFKDTGWIKPGKAAWDWWNGSLGQQGKTAYTTATMKFYVDFAAASGLEYMLIDAGWSPQNDITQMNGKVDVPAVVKYAAEQHVRVWIWCHGTAAVDKQMDAAFPLFAKWGVAGVKVDFIERDDQWGIEFYRRVAEAAAKNKLMVDFHGCTKPTGLNFEYPNVMGFEAVLGMEASKGGARDNPRHHVTLPFTRMLMGQMDYTPGGFDNVTRAEFTPKLEGRPMVMGTRAHHLAMYVLYESPFQMVSDTPGAYLREDAFKFIRDVPAAWDETRALSGRPGEWIVIARRSGKEWFVGAMSAGASREVDVPLDFLSKGVKYTAQVYADAPDADRNPKNTTIDERAVTASDHLNLHLAPDGGAAIRLKP